MTRSSSRATSKAVPHQSNLGGGGAAALHQGGRTRHDGQHDSLLLVDREAHEGEGGGHRTQLDHGDGTAQGRA